jgi:hypothetical protein
MKYIFDIDGTLADCSHRLHFIQPPESLVHFEVGETDWKPDWESFYKDCVNDKPIQPVLMLLLDLQNAGAKIIFVTGRPCKYMNETIQWLVKYTDSPVKGLYMRKNDDHRPDYIVKKEIYETQIKPNLKDESVLGVFEDRKQCVDMWRSLGLTCYQVANGNY